MRDSIEAGSMISPGYRRLVLSLETMFTALAIRGACGKSACGYTGNIEDSVEALRKLASVQTVFDTTYQD